MREQVYGVDFSGARDAGRHIWIARATPVGEMLRVESCYPAADLLGGRRERDQVLRALRELVKNRSRAAVGLDFPFSLPRALVGHDSWESFALAFPGDYPSSEAFRDSCRRAAQGRELRRLTDRIARTPFSPYNIRLYRQTFYGIRGLLHPLVSKDQARILPMQEPAEDKPWLLEVCPASTLKARGLYTPYKGKETRHQIARQHILGALERHSITMHEEGLRSVIVDDAGGDALDSVIAALATFEALSTQPSPDPKEDDIYAIEGYVYVRHTG